jgi:HD-like signal output (HDOD) protein
VLEPQIERLKDVYRRPWARSLAIAMAAERVSQELDLGLEAAAYAAGLLRDAGRPIVAQLALATERRSASGAQRFLSDAGLRRVVDAAFAPVSAALARRWQAPDESVAALEAVADGARAPGRSLAALLPFAEALAVQAGFPVAKRAPDEPFEAALAAGRAALGLDPKAEARAAHHLKERADLMATIRGGLA